MSYNLIILKAKREVQNDVFLFQLQEYAMSTDEAQT